MLHLIRLVLRPKHSRKCTRSTSNIVVSKVSFPRGIVINLSTDVDSNNYQFKLNYHKIYKEPIYNLLNNCTIIQHKITTPITQYFDNNFGKDIPGSWTC